MKNKFNFFDFMLVIAMTVFCARFFLAPPPHDKALSVETVYAGAVSRRPLASDGIYEIKKGFKIEIKSSKVRVAESDCPKKICRHRSWISAPGESIVCAPNKIAISLKGEAGYDAISK